MKLKQTLIIFCLSIFSQTFSLTRRHDIPDRIYRENAHKFPPAKAVCIIEVLKKDNKSVSGRYSGILVSKNWILTAGHVGDIVQKSKIAYAKFGINSNSIQHSVKLKKVVAHPQWKRILNTKSGHDLALIKLQKPVSHISLPMIMRNPLENPHRIFGRKAVFVGFGRSGDGIIGVDESDKESDKRLGAVTIRKGPRSPKLLYSRFDHPDKYRSPIQSLFRTIQSLQLTFNVAPGDSGGSLFIYKDKIFQLAAIATAASVASYKHKKKVDFKYGSVSIYTSISAPNNRSWILKTIRP